MKKHYYFQALAATLACAAFAFTSCEQADVEEDDSLPPVLTIETEDVTIADHKNKEGLTVIYSLENPVDGGVISVAVTPESPSWITVTDYETEGVVTYDVDSNLEREARSATLTITYTYGDGETVSDDIQITQPGNTASVGISAQDLNITAAAGGHSIEYEVLGADQVEAGTISAEVTNWIPQLEDGEAAWLTGITIADNTSAEGEVSFNVLANDTGSERRAVITLTYKYGETSVTKTVTVLQSSGVSIRFVEDEVSKVDLNEYDAPETSSRAQIRYLETNVTSANYLTASATTPDGGEVEWITDFVTDQVVGWLFFNIAANDTAEERTAIVTLTYERDGITASDSFTLTQAAGTGEVAEPEITASETQINVGAEGEEYYFINATVRNPAEGGKVTLTTDSPSWITVPSNNNPAEPNESGFVSMTVGIAENPDNVERSGKLTFTYAYTDSEGTEQTISVEVPVTQEAGAGVEEPEAPVFDFSGTQTEFGSQANHYAYSTVHMSGITDDEFEPYGGKLTIESDQSWISPRFDGSWSEGDGLSFDICSDIQENTTTSARTATITVSYIYAEGQPAVTGSFTVTQEAGEGGEDNPPVTGGEFTVATVLATDWGDNNFGFTFSPDNMYSMTTYIMFSNVYTYGAGTIEGEYTVSSTKEQGTLNPEDSYRAENSDIKGTITSGNLNIVKNADGTYTITGSLTDSSGVTVTINYTGTVIFQ